ncbi:MAG TPA: type VI secretion system tip protein VgrG, partial [Polyangiaceae bacterium]|nr:type VI secretion system tip protein VgrG [Polyangiaceae bacterium]
MGYSEHRLEISFDTVDDLLAVRRFSVQEALSELWDVTVLASTTNRDLALGKIIGQGAGFRVSTESPTVPTRVWAGVVAECEQLHADVSSGSTAQSTYYFRILPQLWRTTQRRNHRIFQRLSLPDIVKALLDEWGQKATWKLTKGEAAYPKHEYVVQYGETDFAFINRLLERAGITFLFSFSGTDEPDLVFTDDPNRGKERGTPLPAFDEPPSSPPAEYAKRIRTRRVVQPGKVLLRDYEFRRSYDAPRDGTSKAKVEPPEDFYEQYHYVPGEFLAHRPGAQPKTPHADDKGIEPRHDEQYGAMQADNRLLSLRKHRTLIRYETNVADLA